MRRRLRVRRGPYGSPASPTPESLSLSSLFLPTAPLQQGADPNPFGEMKLGMLTMMANKFVVQEGDFAVVVVVRIETLR